MLNTLHIALFYCQRQYYAIFLYSFDKHPYLILEKLKVKIGPAKTKVIHGYSHTIECNISGNPIPFTIRWTKKNNGEEIAIVPIKEKYSGGTVGCPSLTIKCFMIDDEGIYVCRATNEAGVGLSNESQVKYIGKH